MIVHLFERIESPAFHAQLGVISGFALFVRALAETPEVQDLTRAALTAEARNALYQRILEVSRRPVDPEFENPWDIALSAYLWALNQQDPSLALAAAEAVVQTEDCWWAKKIGLNIIEAARVHAASEKA
jgi:hypothetical protein